MPDFLGIERITLGPWQAFERALQRLLVHAGFSDVRLVGGTGDQGADIVAEKAGTTWVLQAKHRSSGQLAGSSAVDEVTVAVDRYEAGYAVVAASTGFSRDAVERARKLGGDLGIPLFLWNGEAILERARQLPLYPEHRNAPRPYQEAAIEAINRRVMEGAGSGLLLMATGLGKTRVAAGVIEQWIADRPRSEVLVVVPSLALVPQFEAALWPYLPKTVATHVLTGSEKPAFAGGVTVATEQSARGREDFPGRFGLVVVDEAHHAPADGFRALLDDLEPEFLLGMTATPWRGDERRLEDIFGPPTFAMSIVEGMQLGYLAEVDYRMLIDDIDWEWVNNELRGGMSIRELNRKLFVPELDEAVVAKIRVHLEQLNEPRAVIFCRSIDHAERIRDLLHADGWPCRVLHSALDRIDATRVLREFRAGTVPVIVTVDMVNEGIDIPDVNLIAFLRVTHSRRIFVQQLGRGLRIRPGKTSVRVLDFVSDIRRIAAGLEMNRDASAARSHSPGGRLVYETGSIVKFEGDEQLNFFRQYLNDVAELEDLGDSAQLQFPDPAVAGRIT